MTFEELNALAEQIDSLISGELEFMGIEHSLDLDDIPGVCVFDNDLLVDLYRVRIQLRERLAFLQGGTHDQVSMVS